VKELTGAGINFISARISDRYNISLNSMEPAKDITFDNQIKFPLRKNQFGLYSPSDIGHGENLRCPNCGNHSWLVKSYQHMECTICQKNYSNLGAFGLQEF